MDQPEEVLEKLERFNVQKNPEITRELDEYVSFVARTGESVFNWALVKRLYREKLINVITEFNEASAKELPVYPNVDPFNYETMKKMLIERLDSFNAAPFTIQRISELLADPRKQYSRIDKFMRAVEKNILVVSTVSPGRTRSEEESENGDSLDSVGKGDDFSSDVNVDIDMENENDGSFTMTKEFIATTQRKEGNNDLVSVTQESVTVKIDTKEESSAAAIAINVSTNEQLQSIKTDISIESQSSVTITVCEPPPLPTDEISPTVSTEAAEKSLVDSSDFNEQKSSDTNEEQGVIKEVAVAAATATEPIIPIIEPKIDEDALLNEPLRPADDEILADTTTPLAALENIVANRTVIDETPRNEEQQQKKLEKCTELSTTLSVQEEQIEKFEESVTDGDDSEIEAKRLKLERIDTVSDENLVEKQDICSAVVEEPKVTETETLPPNDQLISSTIVSSIVEELSSDEKSQAQAQKEETVGSEAEDKPQDKIIDTPVDEIIKPEDIITKEVHVPDTDQTSNSIEEITEQQQHHSLPVNANENPPEDDMEAAPIVENQMALDEEVCAASTDVTADSSVNNAGSKMDTDNDTENASMDIDEDEPMDQ